MDLSPGFSASPPQPGDAAGSVGLELTERCRELREILDDRFKGDARMLYEGALRMIVDTTNPARLPLAASAVREIMDDVEREAGFAHQVPDWKERIAKLEKSWKVAERSLGVGSDPRHGFTETLEEFFAAFHRVPSRRALADGAICSSDPATNAPPPAVRDARADAWLTFRRYFNRVLHREIRPSDADFHRQFEAFETFLFDWLRPPTSADLNAIDEVLRKGPPNG